MPQVSQTQIEELIENFSLGVIADSRREVAGLPDDLLYAFQGEVESLFYEHLYLLKKGQLLEELNNAKGLNHASTPFTIYDYWGFEQGALEQSEIVEQKAIVDLDFGYRKMLVDRFRDRLVQIRVTQDLVKANVTFFENFLSYELRHPDSLNNPWKPIYELFRKGILLAFEEKSSPLVCRFYGQNEEFSVKIDDRLHYQSLLFLALKQRALYKHQIIAFLKEYGLSKQKIEDHVFEPLRSMGLVNTANNKQPFQLVKDKQAIETVARYNLLNRHTSAASKTS